MIVLGHKLKLITELFICTEILDVITTITGLSVINGTKELNPSTSIGWPLLLSAKLIVTIIVATFMEVYNKHLWVIYIFPILMSFILIWNGINLLLAL